MNKNISFLGSLGLVFLLSAFCFLLSGGGAQAQPYYTNTAPYGAAQYNSAYPTPLQPSRTLANQYASGTLAGSVASATVPLGGTYTVAFPTNIYSAPPFVVCTTSATNAAAAVTSVTTTNFVLMVQPTNCTVYWEATGH